MFGNSYLKYDEKGSALIVCILTLLVLTLSGLMAMNTANIETQIAGNIRSYKNDFFRAESAVLEMALSIKDTQDDILINSNSLVLPDNSVLPAIVSAGSLNRPEDLLNYRKQIVEDPFSNISSTEPLYNSEVLVVHGGAAQGESMSLGHSHTSHPKHRFLVFGNSRTGTPSGRGVIIEIGYMRKIRL